MNRRVGRAVLSPAEPRRGEDTAPYPLAWFMVPMHDRKAEKAFDEPYDFRVRAPIESGGGPPHSRTLARLATAG
jgi:hypothetical protein